MTPQEVLIKAADYIEEHGWWNGEPGTYRAGGPKCAVMAISHCGGGDHWPALHRFSKWLGETDERMIAVSDWNDAQPDGATVVAALRAAAQKAS